MTKFFKKFSLIFATCLIVGVAYAAGPIASSGLVGNNPAPTARPGIVATTVGSVNGAIVSSAFGPRMPTLKYTGGSPTPTPCTGNNCPNTCTGTSCYLADKDCISQYQSCLKASDVCGANFENCTNKTLFFAAKSNCTSTLLQCSPNATKLLFGTNDQSILATQDTTIKDDFGNYIYTYPTDNSILGGMIKGAAISQQLSTQDCVKKYTQCLNGSSVCGSDFALCTTDAAFKKQKIFCASTLARCGNTGLMELWGTTDTTANPIAPGRIRTMIDEGANLAAANAVSTCYKIADNCILQACGPNPYLCKVGVDQTTANAAAGATTDASTAAAAAGTNAIAPITANNSGPITAAQVRALIQGACLDTIGGSQYCYMTVNPGKIPAPSDLADQDTRLDTFDNIYGTRFNTGMQANIDKMINAFNTKQNQTCQNTIVSCAMRNCGGGIGSVCYSQAYDSVNNATDVTLPAPLSDIRAGCEAIVNADPACIYAAAAYNYSNTKIYNVGTYGNNSIFDTLFTSPHATSGPADPIGAVGMLNSRLASSFNTAALKQLQTQCEQVASNCVKSQCGTDYMNCFRNRNDVVSSIGGMPDNTAAGNRVAGVLDRAIVIGLCIDTVKNDSSCQQHIQVEAAKLKTGTLGTNATSVWTGGATAGTTAAAGWIDGATVSFKDMGHITDTRQQMRDGNGNLLCLADQSNTADYGRCDGSDDQKDATGKVVKSYTIPFMVASDDYAVVLAQNQIFQALIGNMELNAQAIYNKKMTAQMNTCHAQNEGGIMGKNDMYSDFMWTKLKVKKIPADYSVNGLLDTQIIASNDLYGSFCRVRVSIKSNDPMINQLIQQGKITDASGKNTLLSLGNDKSWTYRNFAVGDAFTCGSWIPQDTLQKISQLIYDQAHVKATAGNTATRNWLTALGSVVGAVGGGIGMNSLQNGPFGGLLGTNPAQRISTIQAQNCQNAFDTAINMLKNYPTSYAVRGPAVYNPANNKEVLGYTYTLVGAQTNISPAALQAQKQEQDRMAAVQQQAVNNANKGYTDAVVKQTLAQKALDDAKTAAAAALRNDPAHTGITDAGVAQLVPQDKAVIQAQKDLDAATSAVTATQDLVFQASQNSVGNMGNTGYVPVPTAIAEMNAAKAQCTNPEAGKNNFWSNGGGKAVLDTVGVVGGGILGGIVVNKLVKSQQAATADAAAAAAQADWMANVGSKILCYIGSDQIGQFGDIRSTSME